MAYFGSALLLVLLHHPSLEVYAAQSEVYTFEYYADASCSLSALVHTSYIKAVTGPAGCYVYTDVNGGVASGASSFILACGDTPEYTKYESENCRGPIDSSVTEPWFATIVCASQGIPSSSLLGPGGFSPGTLAFDGLSQPGTVFTSRAPSSCTKSYLPM